jgi:hypothetical protein
MTLIETLQLRDAQREAEAARAVEEAKRLAEKNRNDDNDWKKTVEENTNKRFWIGLAVTISVTIIASIILNAPLWFERWQRLSAGHPDQPQIQLPQQKPTATPDAKPPSKNLPTR